MPLLDWLRSLDKTPLAEWVQASTYAFPGLEAAHVIAVMLVFGSIAMLDLRLLGVSSRSHSVTRVSTEVLPWTWAAFWEMSPVRRAGARLAAPLCLLLWMATVCAGRWLAYGYVLFPDA